MNSKRSKEGTTQNWVAHFRHVYTYIVLCLILIHGQITYAQSSSGKALRCREVLQESAVQYGGIQFDITRVSGSHIKLYPTAKNYSQISVNSPIVRSIKRKWDLNEFQTPRLPELIGEVKDPQSFSTTNFPRVLELPIMRPGTEIRLPKEFGALRDTIQQMIDTEKAINPEFEKYHAYLTVDQSYVPAGNTQRVGGVHVDGFQGTRQVIKSEPDHSYIVTDTIPTVFYEQPFEFSYLTEKNNYFKEMDRQAYELTARRLEPYKIFLMDAYSPHRADVAKAPTRRTFVRITFSRSQYDRLGETDNPAFEPIQRFQRQIPESLIEFKPDDTNFTGRGYVKTVSELSSAENHTIQDIQTYVRKQLGNDLIANIQEKNQIFIATGSVPAALENVNKMGWTLLKEVVKEEGFHRVFLARHKSGAQGYVIIRINSPERLVHIHSLLKIAGVPGEVVYTFGRFKSWKHEIFKNLTTFRKPKVVIYGFSNTVLDGVLQRNPESMKLYPRIEDAYKSRRQKVELTDHELANIKITVLKMATGDFVWLIPNLYGSMAKDLFEVIREIAPERIAYFGTAGALHSGLSVGDKVLPQFYIKNSESPQRLNHVEAPNGAAHAGTYIKVSTFLTETESWLARELEKGVDITEVEFGPITEVLRNYRGRFFASLFISDVLSGNLKSDITQAGYGFNKSLAPYFKKIFQEISGLSDSVPVQDIEIIDLVPPVSEL